MLQIGVQLKALRQPLKKAIQTAGAIGAKTIEIDMRNQLRPEELSQTGIRHLKKMLSDYDLKVATVEFPTMYGYNQLEQLDRRVAATKEAMTKAYAMGVPVLINKIGGVDPDMDAQTNQMLREVLLEIGQHAHSCGVMFAAKTGGVDGPVLSQFLRTLPDGTVMVDFDPGAMILNGFSADESYRALAPYVVHVRGRDSVQDLARGRGLDVPLGRGAVDFRTLIARLEEARYKGVITVGREQPEYPVEEATNAVQYLRNLQEMG